MDGARLECVANEKALHDWLMEKKNSFMKEAFTKSGLPQDMLANLNPDKPLTRDERRKRFAADMAKEIDTIERGEFGMPERYGQGGKDAVIGRDCAIAIFLPPIALGFSITVCLLHLASFAAKFTNRSAICYGTAFIVWLLPAFFATNIPISGFWGI